MHSMLLFLKILLYFFYPTYQDILTMKTAYGTALPIYCSSSFKWSNNIHKNGTCNASELIKLDTEHLIGDYHGIVIRSRKTGDDKYFEPIYDEDGYDGEFMVYRCNEIFVTIWNY